MTVETPVILPMSEYYITRNRPQLQHFKLACLQHKKMNRVKLIGCCKQKENWETVILLRIIHYELWVGIGIFRWNTLKKWILKAIFRESFKRMEMEDMLEQSLHTYTRSVTIIIGIEAVEGWEKNICLWDAVFHRPNHALAFQKVVLRGLHNATHLSSFTYFTGFLKDHCRGKIQGMKQNPLFYLLTIIGDVAGRFRCSAKSQTNSCNCQI